jgi:hypothetical protein
LPANADHKDCPDMVLKAIEESDHQDYRDRRVQKDNVVKKAQKAMRDVRAFQARLDYR